MKKSLLIPLLIIALTGCKKLLFDSVATDYKSTFDYLWQRINDHYCCFDTSGLDWNEVYADYAPQVTDDMNEAAFIDLIDEMLLLLKDNNLSVTGPFGSIRYDDSAQYPLNVDTNTTKLYNPDNLSYVIHDSIAYINNFDSLIVGVRNIKDANIKAAILDFRNLVYLDIEGTGGNSIRSIAEKTIGVIHKKTGAAMDDFEESPLLIGGNQYSIGYANPIVILINYQVRGENSKSAYRLSETPNTILVGTTTGEANFEVATTSLPNGWLLNTPEAAILNLQGNSIGLGIQPDSIVEDDIMTTEIDEVIEAALNMLR